MHRWEVRSNQNLVHIKVIILLYHIHLMARLLHGFGCIFDIICTFGLYKNVNEIIYHLINILLRIQIVAHHKD